MSQEHLPPGDGGMIGSPAEEKELRVKTQKENTKMKKLGGENVGIQQHFL